MKSHHKERMLIALGCVAGFAVVLLVERMNHGAKRTAVSSPAVADVQLATVSGPAEGVVSTNAPWEWSARPAKWSKLQQVRVDRSASVQESISLRPRQFDLIDFRHQPSVTVDLGR